MQMKSLKSGWPPSISEDTLFLYLELHFWRQPFGLEWYTIVYKDSSRFDLYNPPSSDISTTNLQKAPCLMQTLNINHLHSLSIKHYLFEELFNIAGFPAFGTSQTALAASDQLTASQHGSSSPDRLWLRILISTLAASLPLRQSILNVLAAERATMSSAANHI